MDQGFLSFRQVNMLFEVYKDIFNNFKDVQYLVTPFVGKLMGVCVCY